MVGWANGELKWLWLNPFSALLTAGLGSLAIVGVRLGRRVLVQVASGGFALMSLYVVAFWRYGDGDWTGGILGATGPNLAFWGMLALGLFLAGGQTSSERPASSPAHTTTTT